LSSLITRANVGPQNRILIKGTAGKAIVSAFRGSTSITTSSGWSSDCGSSGWSSKRRIVGFGNPVLISSARAASSSFGLSRAIQLATTKSVLNV
jgi:hypothetical protein